MQGTVAELPGVRVLSQQPSQLSQPLGTAQETPAYKHKQISPLQPLTSELYTHPPDPAGTGSNLTFRLTLGKESSA